MLFIFEFMQNKLVNVMLEKFTFIYKIMNHVCVWSIDYKKTHPKSGSSISNSDKKMPTFAKYFCPYVSLLGCIPTSF